MQLNLCLSGQLIIRPNSPLLDAASFDDILKLRMAEITSPRQANRVVYVSDSIKKYNFVQAKDSATKHPFKPAYISSYKIIKRYDKHLTVTINNQENISIECLKLHIWTILMTILQTLKYTYNQDPQRVTDILNGRKKKNSFLILQRI